MYVRVEAIDKATGERFKVYGFITNSKGRVTHISVEPNSINGAAWEPVTDFTLVDIGPKERNK